MSNKVGELLGVLLAGIGGAYMGRKGANINAYDEGFNNGYDYCRQKCADDIKSKAKELNIPWEYEDKLDKTVRHRPLSPY